MTFHSRKRRFPAAIDQAEMRDIITSPESILCSGIPYIPKIQCVCVGSPLRFRKEVMKAQVDDRPRGEFQPCTS